VCCSVLLQCVVAVCRSVLQYFCVYSYIHFDALQYVAVCCSVLQCVAVCRSVLQYFCVYSYTTYKRLDVFEGAEDNTI